MPSRLLRIIRLIASAGALTFAATGAFAVGEGSNPTVARPFAPTTGTIDNLVIFIRFSDQPEFTQPLSYYDGLFNSAGNSLKNFYLENSYNALTVNSTFYPTSGGAMVSYQDAHPTAYYQAYNATTNPLGYQGAESTARETALVTNALAAVSGQVPAGLNLDGNNDGYVDHITFEVYSTAANPAPVLFYSRAAYDWSGGVVFNGKKLGAYTWVTGAQDTPNTGVTLGATEIHEMGHSFGYPDLRANSGRQPVGDWDVMSTSRVVHSGAYMKNRFTNWIPSIPEITTYGSYTLNDITQSTNNSYKLKIPNSSEYLILEYRKAAGAFEANLFGSGLCVTRVNEAAGIWGNLGGPPFFLYYYRLNGTAGSDGTGNAWEACFSAETGRVQFNNTSNPACFLSDGSACGISIANIGSAAGSSITFSLADPTAAVVTRRISGILSLGGSRVSGASITLSGGASGVTTSDSLGNYNFVVSDGGSYTVTPSKANLTFNPANKSFATVTSDQTQNFTATNNTNTITGTVNLGGAPLSGATIACNGGCSPQLATTDANGAYSFTVNAGSNYDVYPAGPAGYYFSPNTKNFANITTNQSQTFTAQAITTTTLASSANPSVSGQSVTFTATVAGGTPTGSVTFNSSGVAVCSAVPVSNGQAQCATSSLAAGNRSISAAYSGDSGSSSSSAVLTQVVTQATATVPGSPTSVTASAGSGQATVSFAAPASTGGATITGYTVTSSPGGGVDSNAGSTATSHTMTGLTNGTSYTFTVKATNSAGTGAASAASTSVTPQETQTIGAISFSPASVAVGGATSASASATSGLAVTFSSTTTGICSVSGSTVSGVAPGTCTIAANQAGNAGYAPAPQVTQAITVGPGSQSINFGAAPVVVVGGTGTVAATGGASGNPVTFTSTTPSICTVFGATVTGISAGTCSIATDQPGDANYAAAVQVTQNVTIGKANQTIGSISIATLTLGVGGTTTVSATATSSLVPTFTSTTPGVCTISGTTIRGVSAGTCTIAANQIGNANYNAAPQATQDSSVVDLAVPGAPTAVSASRENSRVAVSFNAPSSNGGSPVVSYTVTSSPGGITATGAGSPIAMAGLSNGATYTFTVTASNIIGTGAPSAASNALTLPLVAAQSGTLTALTDTTPIVASAGSTLVVPSGTATSGTSITLTGSAASTSAAPVTMTIDGQSISVQPAKSDALVTLKTVTVNGAQTLALGVGSGTVSVSAASGRSMLVLANSSAPIVAGTGGASVSQTVDGTTGVSALAVTDGQVVLPAASFDASALKDGKVYAGETAQFDASGRITEVRLGSASGQGGAGDALKPGASNGMVLSASVPDMRQASGRTGGVTLVSGFAAAVAQGAGIGFDTSAQNASGILNLSFEGGWLNALPVGNVLIDTSRPDGLAVSGSKIEVTRNGLVTTIVPSVGDLSDFASRLSAISAGSNTTILSDGTIRAVVNGETYLLQPGWVATRDAGAAGFSSGNDGYLNYVDGAATRQVLYPAFADLSQLTATLRKLDPNISVIASGNGSIVARLAAGTYSLVPDYTIVAVPFEHAGDPWWSGANGKIFIKYSDGKAQGFLVK